MLMGIGGDRRQKKAKDSSKSRRNGMDVDIVISDAQVNLIIGGMLMACKRPLGSPMAARRCLLAALETTIEKWEF